MCHAANAEVISEHQRLRDASLRVDDTAVDMIQAPELEPRIMRYELSDYKWTASNRCCRTGRAPGRRANDRRVLNGIFWMLRSSAQWRDLPGSYGHTRLATIASYADDSLAPCLPLAGSYPHLARSL
jgi:hypothetical protein